MEFTLSQLQRLRELGDDPYKMDFATAGERDSAFSELSSHLTSDNNSRVSSMFDSPERHILSKLEESLAKVLTDNGFIEVRTPLIISKTALKKMTIDENSRLYRQVFWIDDKRCLRPMLAPNLYFVMRKLRDRTSGPVKIFEIGSCFRKESRSSYHIEEFTMLNLVDLGSDNPSEDLKRYISMIMDRTGLRYSMTEETSEIYKSTVDVEVNGNEVASGATGPHHLDEAHDIHEPWCGAGFGLERLLMEMMDKKNIKKVGRSLVYLNGTKIDM